VAEHKLPEGKRWIENLLALGSAMGYQPEPEYDVLAHEDRESPVDVAWFRSEEDRFPLFIFEVETRASGQMSHNAGKVFTQDTELFQKPLFHFHLIVEGSKENTRADVAEAAYGKFNYRIYGVADGEGTEALCDILSQHRRVSDRLDVSALAVVLDSERWPEIDLDQVWSHAEDCHFRGEWLRSYGALALSDPDAFLKRLLRFLETRYEEGDSAPTTGYGTFIGEHCGSALHAALLAENDPEQGVKWLGELRSWQEHDGVMRMAAPYPGLSEEGDDFVFALMPGLWALIAVMFVEVEGARRWILEQMELVISTDTGLSLVAVAATAIWMLHVAADEDGDERHFELARERLNADGGISAGLLAAPPALGGYIADYDEWWERLQAEKELVPNLDEFRERFGGSGEAGDGTPIALSYLLDEQPPEAGQEIRELLAS
jgi:hypothetical protein